MVATVPQTSCSLGCLHTRALPAHPQNVATRFIPGIIIFIVFQKNCFFNYLKNNRVDLQLRDDQIEFLIVLY